MRVGLRSAVLTLLIFVGCFSQAENFSGQVFTNGKIITVNQNFDIVEALAIRGGKFLAVGSNRQVLDAAGSNAEIIDLKGRTVIPGFIDGHAHMDREGLKFILPSLQGVHSIEDILAVVRQEVKNKKPGEWIVTMPIGDYPDFNKKPSQLKEKRYPTRWDLDRVAPNNPVYIKGRWFYWSFDSPIVSIANSYALKLAGISNETQAPYPALKIFKNSLGVPNGIFEEPGPLTAIEYSLMKVVPRFSHQDRVDALIYSMQQYNSVGTTSVYEGHGVAPPVIQAYKELHEQGKLTVRSHLVMSPAWDTVAKVKPLKIMRNWASYVSGKGTGDELLRISGIYTAVGNSRVDDIRRKDSNHPNWSGFSVDVLLPKDRASLFDLLSASAKTNIRAHAITYLEKDIDQHLQALEKVHQETPIDKKRFVMEHVSFVSEQNQHKIKKLGVIPTVIPGPMIWKSGLRQTRNLEPIKANTYVPLKSFVEKGIPFVIGTDNIPYNPLHALWASVTRVDATTGKVSSPEQRISRKEALKALTINAAYLSYEEDIKGSIEVGKLADMAILSKDYLTVPDEEIRHIEVLMTLLGGQVVFKSESY